MNRRALLASAVMALVAAPFSRIANALPVQSRTKKAKISDKELEPFREIAKKKGAKLFANQEPPAAQKQTLHLDMDMVKASLENAIERTAGKPELNEKLRRLLSNGTAAQQVDFVLGTGTYYFPEDLEEVAKSGKIPVASGAQCWVCENVCTLVCNCLGNGDQYCKERCRQVCRKYC